MKKEIYTDFAWECLRRNKNYINAWKINESKITENERQQHIDLDAEIRWGLLKYVNPEHSRPEKVFWSPKLSKKSLPIILGKNGDFAWKNIVKNSEVRHEKIFLLDGSLCIKIFNHNDYFQFFISDASELTDESKIFLYMPLSLNNSTRNRNIDIINSIFNDKVETANREGQQQDLLDTIDGINEGFSHRAIASRIFGEQLVESEWSSDSWLRANIRYRIKKAINLIDTGYLNYL
ncbi:DUF2285 domain-containing protein [Enterobacteriaceae bacterium 4M9]|nr:DUF2285 domain-containing protein [Enterobacteriaceae bacterium 4M9]